MAEKETAVSLSSIERQWVHKSLETQRAVLVRSRQKEMAGSDVWFLRAKEIETLSQLMFKFGS